MSASTTDASATPARSRLAEVDGWLTAALALAAVVVLPVLALAWTATHGSAGLWSHIAATVLPQAARNTAVLLLGVGVISVVIGTGTAWLISAYDFPGRRILAWALLLPLAMPTYIIAYTYLDLLHPLGPVQGALRALLGYDSPRAFRLPDIRGMAGCIVLLGFVLYPYVYMTTRAMFATQAASLLEAAQSLGASRAAMFWRVALPLARPALAVGAALALLEVLNDIGASEFLGVQTLTVSIYTTWITRSDLAGAAQIALAMLVLVVALLMIERSGRRRQRYASVQRPRALQPQRLAGVAGWAACALASLPVLIGFLAPTMFLATQSWKRIASVGMSDALLASTWNSLRVATLATAVTVLAGLVLVWALRSAQLRRRPRLAAVALRTASLGYAIPGTVLAIGLLAPLTGFDAAWQGLLRWLALAPQGLLMGSVSALVVAYMVRFLTISAGGLEAGISRVPFALDQAARSLGERPSAVLWRVHLPLLRPAMAAAALLVFVDTMKELPIVLLLRPLNFDTLATWLYADASRGAYEDGALAALLIVLVGLLPVALLARVQNTPPTPYIRATPGHSQART